MKRILFIFIVLLSILNLDIFADELDSSNKTEPVIPRQLSYNGDNYRDPLMPLFPKKEPERKPEEAIRPVALGAEGVETPGLNIQGMVWDTDMPQAIINGEIYKVGDQFQEIKILDINKDGIKLLYKDRILIMKPEIAKQTRESRR